MPKFGRLQPVELRDAWPNEAQDFTPWLAQEENLALLGEVLGMELELEGKEMTVGDFRADILCKNEDDSWVLIENQLEETNHDHLGKILTYSAGLDARTVIWIAAKFRDEHRAALDRQNEITDERFQYFGIEMKVWKIGNSVPAPEFDIVSKPNDWIPSISSRSLDDWKTQFWAQLNQYFRETNLHFNIRRPGSKNSVNFGIGNSSEFSLEARMSQQRRRIGVRLNLIGENAEAYFYLLKEDKQNIEAAFGKKLEWEELPQRKFCAVSLHKGKTDPQDEDDWQNQHEWMASKLTKFDKVFRELLRELDPADWKPREDSEEVEELPKDEDEP